MVAGRCLQGNLARRRLEISRYAGISIVAIAVGAAAPYCSNLKVSCFAHNELMFALSANAFVACRLNRSFRFSKLAPREFNSGNELAHNLRFWNSIQAEHSKQRSDGAPSRQQRRGWIAIRRRINARQWRNSYGTTSANGFNLCEWRRKTIAHQLAVDFWAAIQPCSFAPLVFAVRLQFFSNFCA